MIASIEARYEAIEPEIRFARTSPNPVDRRLDFCAYFLATIQEMEQRGQVFEEMRSLCLQVTLEFVKPENAWEAWLKRLPARLVSSPLRPLLSALMQRKMGKKGHPDGFLVQIITRPEETHGLKFGFDILECGICHLFQKHHAGQYASILCEVDYLTSSLAGLELIRSGTLATGASKCDFRFKIQR